MARQTADDQTADETAGSPAREDALETAAAERRRHARIAAPLKARVLRTDGSEMACLVVNVSAGGALLKAREAPDAGERVVLYVDDVGRFEGKVMRASRHLFAVDYRSRRAKSQRTADALTSTINKARQDPDRRNAPRVREASQTSIVHANGDATPCSIIDISLTGASIEVDPKPPLGADLRLGKMAARVVRVHERGVAVIFTGPASRLQDTLDGVKND